MSFPRFRKSRKWLSAQELWLLVLALFLFIALLAANISVARILPGGEWLFMRWSGVRAFLTAQADASREGMRGGRLMPDGVATILTEETQPYRTGVAQETQQVAYGRPAFSSEYAYVLNDPFFILLLYMPLVLLHDLVALISPWLASGIDFVFIRALWMVFCQIALAGTVLLAINLSEWQPPRWLYSSLLVFGLFSYFSLNALVTATPTIMLAFLYLWILVALRSHADELAGVLMPLVAYQWEAGGLFFLFLLAFVIANRRWHVLAGFGMSLFVLLAVSFLVYPRWGLPYLLAVISDWERGMNLTLGHMLATLFPAVTVPLGRIVSILVAIVLLLEWIGSMHAHFRRVVWTVSLSLAATPLIGFAIFPSNHIVLILPFVLILALVWERWQRRRVLMIVLILFFVLLAPFGLYLRAVMIYDPLVNDLMAILPPLAAMMGLYWMRWWVVRSPRTWFDQIGDQT